MKIFAIAALDESRVIGNEGKLPWHIPEDLKRFSGLTKGHTVLMGRKTYVSIPEKVRPLPGRLNLVCTKSSEILTAIVPEKNAEVRVVADLEYFFRNTFPTLNSSTLRGEILWVLGGSEIYEKSLPFLDGLEITRVKGQHEGDVYFPEFESLFELKTKEEHPTFSFERWERKR